MPELYKRKSNTKCVICGKGIYRRPKEFEITKGEFYCSQLCYGLSCRKEKPCVVCKKLILSALNRITCSRVCSNRYRAGIKYKIGRPVKNKVQKIKLIKNRLFSLRGGKCERCGYNKEEVLQIHHKDRNNRNNDFKNLEILCPNCHYENHYLKEDR